MCSVSKIPISVVGPVHETDKKSSSRDCWTNAKRLRTVINRIARRSSTPNPDIQSPDIVDHLAFPARLPMGNWNSKWQILQGPLQGKQLPKRKSLPLADWQLVTDRKAATWPQPPQHKSIRMNSLGLLDDLGSCQMLQGMSITHS